MIEERRYSKRELARLYWPETKNIKSNIEGTGTCFTQSRREYDSCWYSYIPNGLLIVIMFLCLNN